MARFGMRDCKGPPPGKELMSGASPRLYQRIVSIMSEQIATGRLGPGDRLVENRLAQEFGVSRAPVRQALAELCDAGLIRRGDGGYSVPPSRDRSEPEVAEGRPFTASALTLTPSWQPIYAEVEDQITSRIAFCSWRIVETALAEAYGVSRTVARDVLARLQQRGLVRNQGGKWIAPALSDRRVAELYALRAILEPAALREASPRADPALLEAMHGRLIAAMEQPDPPTGAQLDELENDLHVRFLGYCTNETLLDALVQHQSLLIAHRFLYRTTTRLYRLEPFLPEHMEIVELLREGAVDAAARALERHLLVSKDRAVDRLKWIRDTASPEDMPHLRRIDE